MSFSNVTRPGIQAARTQMQIKNQQSQAEYLQKKKKREALERRKKIERHEKMKYGCEGKQIGSNTRQRVPEATRQTEMAAARARMQERYQESADMHREKEMEKEAQLRRQKIERWERMNPEELALQDPSDKPAGPAHPPIDMAAVRAQQQQRYQQMSQQQRAKAGSFD